MRYGSHLYCWIFGLRTKVEAQSRERDAPNLKYGNNKFRRDRCQYQNTSNFQMKQDQVESLKY